MTEMSLRWISRAYSLREAGAIGDDAVKQIVDDAFVELAIRSEHCGAGGRYPYEIRRNGSLLARRLTPALGQVAHGPSLLVPAAFHAYEHEGQQEPRWTRCHHIVRASLPGSGYPVLGRACPLCGAIVFGTGRQTNDLEDHEELDKGSSSQPSRGFAMRSAKGSGFSRILIQRCMRRTVSSTLSCGGGLPTSGQDS